MMRNSKNPRVLFILHSANLFGAERLHSELVKNLRTRNFETISLLPSIVGGLSELVHEAGGEVRYQDDVQWWTEPSLDLSIEKLFNHYVTKSITEMIEAERIDVVITHTGVIPYGALASKVSGVPHIWYLHEFLDKDHGMKIPLGRENFSAFVESYSDQIWVNSRAIANYFQLDKLKKTKIVYNIPNIEKDLMPFSDRKTKRNIGVIGNFNGGKNIELVIRSCSLLKASTSDFQLHIFGWGSDDKVEELTNLINSLGLSNNVIFQGENPDLYQMYSKIDVLVMASKNESFGRTPFEAMQLGIPVVCSISEATNEYMRDRENGLLFDPDSPEDLSLKLLDILDSEGVREELVRNALDSFEKWKLTHCDPELPSTLVSRLIWNFRIKKVLDILRLKMK
jgi:glycosyltransferase involved in cell wall biosynthesis